MSCEQERVRMWEKEREKMRRGAHGKLEECRSLVRRDGARLHVAHLQSDVAALPPVPSPPVHAASDIKSVAVLVHESGSLVEEITSLEADVAWDRAHAALGVLERPHPLPPLVMEKACRPPDEYFSPLKEKQMEAARVRAWHVLQGFRLIILAKRESSTARTKKATSRLDELRVRAAIVIQRVYRGSRSRKHTKKMKSSRRARKPKKTFAEMQAEERKLRAKEHWAVEGRFDVLNAFDSNMKHVGGNVAEALRQTDAEREVVVQTHRELYEREAEVLRADVEAQRTLLKSLVDAGWHHQDMKRGLEQRLYGMGVDMELYERAALRIQKIRGVELSRHRRRVQRRLVNRGVLERESALAIGSWWRGHAARRRVRQVRCEQSGMARTILVEEITIFLQAMGRGTVVRAECRAAFVRTAWSRSAEGKKAAQGSVPFA